MIPKTKRKGTELAGRLFRLQGKLKLNVLIENQLSIALIFA